MTAFGAIVGDTWRQSKQQVVFFVLAAGLLLVGSISIFAFKVRTTESNEKVIWIPFGDNKEVGFDLLWDAQYRDLIHKELGHEKALEEKNDQYALAKTRFEGLARDPKSSQDDIQKANDDLTEKRNDLKALQQKQSEEAQEVVDQRAKGLSRMDKGVEMWMHWSVKWLFTASMWIFIACCAVYFPGMLSAGAVDVLVSKPVSRAQLFFGKFAGGLVLYVALLTIVYLLVWVGVGARTGVWHMRFFAGIPTTIFSAALLYGIVDLIEVLTRSTTFSIIIGYVFYALIDSFVGLIQNLKNILPDEGMAGTVKSVSEFANAVLPGFGRLEDSAAASVMNVPIAEAQPFIVAGVWLAICLGIAYWRFLKTDF